MLIAAYTNIQYQPDTPDCMQSYATWSVISQSFLSCPQRNLACLIACNMAHHPYTAVSLHAARQSRPVVAAATTSVQGCTGLLLHCDETDSLSVILEPFSASPPSGDGPLPFSLNRQDQVNCSLTSIVTSITIASRDSCRETI
jgi:hypothetical protein